MARRPDLIVPVRDRRQRKRYLTLKNFGWAMLVFGVLIVGVNIASELRGTRADYGRLFQREIPDPIVQKKAPVEVVTEEQPAPVPDQTHADPMLLQPQAREQWLHDTPLAPAAAIQPIPIEAERAEAAVASGETRVAIVGGTEGVTVVKNERRKPVLSGGFGRR